MRDVMRNLVVLVVLVVLAATSASIRAETGDGSYDIGYIWTPYLQGALDYREIVVEQLGPDVGRHLEIVLGGSGNYGVIYDREGTDAEAARTIANTHHRVLQRAFGGDVLLADILLDKGFDRLFHVRYMTCDEPRECHSPAVDILGKLEDSVARALVIRPARGGRYELVYEAYKPEAAARKLAVAQARLLGEERFSVKAVPAGFGLAVWDSTSAAGPSALETDEAADTAGTAESRGAGREAPSANGTSGSSSSVDNPQGRSAEAETETTRVALLPDNRTERARTGRGRLRGSMDRALRNRVNARIQEYRRRGVVASNERTAWLVYDLANDRTLVAINADVPLQCASMVKPLVALAFFHEVKRGRFIYGSRSRAKLEAMIQRSDNSATNWFIDTIGGAGRVQAILDRYYGELFASVSIVERIPPGGTTYRNRASAEDYGRFLRALWRRELPHSDEILRVMNLPNSDRIYRSVPEIPSGTSIYDKTGTTSRLCGDMGILVARDRRGRAVPYVFVGIVEKEVRHRNLYHFSRSRGDVIRDVSGLVYADLKGKRNLR